MHAPASPLAASGKGTACTCGRQQYSLAVPSARPHAAFHNHTR
jgi:hypothetical protein